MAMGAVGDVGRRTGLFLSFAAIGALTGPPISGAINSATDGFEVVGWFAGELLRVPFCHTFLAWIRRSCAILGLPVAVDTISSSRKVEGQVLNDLDHIECALVTE